MSELCVQR